MRLYVIGRQSGPVTSVTKSGFARAAVEMLSIDVISISAYYKSLTRKSLSIVRGSSDKNMASIINFSDLACEK